MNVRTVADPTPARGRRNNAGLGLLSPIRPTMGGPVEIP